MVNTVWNFEWFTMKHFFNILTIRLLQVETVSGVKFSEFSYLSQYILLHIFIFWIFEYVYSLLAKDFFSRLFLALWSCLCYLNAQNLSSIIKTLKSNILRLRFVVMLGKIYYFISILRLFIFVSPFVNTHLFWSILLSAAFV